MVDHHFIVRFCAALYFLVGDTLRSFPVLNSLLATFTSLFHRVIGGDSGTITQLFSADASESQFYTAGTSTVGMKPTS